TDSKTDLSDSGQKRFFVISITRNTVRAGTWVIVQCAVVHHIPDLKILHAIDQRLIYERNRRSLHGHVGISSSGKNSIVRNKIRDHMNAVETRRDRDAADRARCTGLVDTQNIAVGELDLIGSAKPRRQPKRRPGI